MVDTATVSRGTTGLGPARLGLGVLALAVFGAVTTEMLPVGLLPAVSPRAQPPPEEWPRQTRHRCRHLYRETPR